MTTLLIDGDILVYRVAHIGTQEGFDGTKYVNEEAVKEYIDSLIDYISQRLFTKKIFIFLSGKSNFRKQLVPTYKENRKKLEKPLALNFTYEYLLNHPHFEVVKEDLLEADDLLGLNANKDSVICTIDKDLDQIPGYHYNWKNDEFYVVKPEEAYKLLWRQILSGDAIDGYKGIPGIGKKKALKLLNSLKKEHEQSFENIEFWWNQVLKIYEEHDLTEEEATQNAICAYILRNNDYNFDTHEIKTPFMEVKF